MVVRIIPTSVSIQHISIEASTVPTLEGTGLQEVTMTMIVNTSSDTALT